MQSLVPNQINCVLVSADAKKFVKATSKCTSAFGKCRKYEDDVGTAIQACK